jgi:hypothetical protein
MSNPLDWPVVQDEVMMLSPIPTTVAPSAGEMYWTPWTANALVHPRRSQYGRALSKKPAAIVDCGLGRRNRNEDH